MNERARNIMDVFVIITLGVIIYALGTVLAIITSVIITCVATYIAFNVLWVYKFILKDWYNGRRN